MKGTYRGSCLLIVLLVCISGGPRVVLADHSLPAQTLLLAEDVGRWLADHAVERPAGVAWPDDALNPGVVGYDLGSGVAGKVLYFVALYRATGKQEYLDLALGGADYLAAILREPGVFDTNSRKAGLYTGVPGIGVALVNVRQHAPRGKYDAALQDLLALLDDWSVDGPAGLHWSDDFNDLLYGDAGTVLFLSWYADQTGDRHAADLAHRGAHFLLNQAIVADEGKYWLFRRSKEFNLPNFSHGTAGISYVLATVGAQSGDASLKLGAQAGFDYIKSIAEIDGDFMRIPYGWGSESWDGLYEFGWAHGLVGTVAMFMRLQDTNIDAQSAAEYERLARHTLQNINLPGTPSPPFAEPSTPMDYRFGRAGVLAFLDEEQTALQTRVWMHLEQAAINGEGVAHWEVDAPEFMGGGRAAYTGFLHGAAGMGLAVLDMHARLSGREPYVDLPDNPRD